MDIDIDAFPDTAALNTLMAAAWGHADPSRDWAPVLNRSLTHLCAFENGQLIGFVNVAWDGGMHAFLLDTSVHPDFQRQGIATRLVRTAIDVARTRGAQWLHVDYVPALDGFYQTCGFRPTAAGLVALSAADG